MGRRASVRGADSRLDPERARRQDPHVHQGLDAVATPRPAGQAVWWWAVSPLANPRLTTEDFVQAWRRVVDIFRAVGATNVSWAWVVNSYPADPSLQPGIDANIGAYYPG